MTQVVLCHGIGYKKQHREGMHTAWYESLRTGMVDTGLVPVEPSQVAAVYYGNCFRSLGGKAPLDSEDLGDIPNFGESDLREDLERELLCAFAENVRLDEGDTKGLIQGMLRRLQASRLLGDVPAKVIIWMIKQMHRYLTDEQLRACVQGRFEALVTPATRVVIAHSLGSVVAYEAMCAHPEWQVDTLITLGSPLGLRTISSRLTPPVVEGVEVRWPGSRRWVNVAAKEDPVALVKELGPIFGKDIDDKPVSNGRFAAHTVLSYLTTGEAAQAIADSLSRG